MENLSIYAIVLNVVSPEDSNHMKKTKIFSAQEALVERGLLPSHLYFLLCSFGGDSFLPSGKCSWISTSNSEDMFNG